MVLLQYNCHVNRKYKGEKLLEIGTFDITSERHAAVLYTRISMSLHQIYVCTKFDHFRPLPLPHVRQCKNISYNLERDEIRTFNSRATPAMRV